MLLRSPYLAWTKTVENPKVDPATRDEAKAEGLGELLKGNYGVWLQAIKPSHHHWSQAGWKYFAHQILVFGMDGHPLVKLAHILIEGA